MVKEKGCLKLPVVNKVKKYLPGAHIVKHYYFANNNLKYKGNNINVSQNEQFLLTFSLE